MARVEMHMMVKFIIRGKRYTFKYEPKSSHKQFYVRRAGFGWEYIDRPMFQRVLLKLSREWEADE